MTSTETEIELAPDLIKMLTPMITAVPDFEPGDGQDILRNLLNAKTIEDVEAPWSGGRELPIGVPIVITQIAKAPSDFMQGLGFYLVLNCTVPHNGEQKVFVSGSTNIVGQLLALYTQGNLPVRCIAVKAEKPSKNGFYPQHLSEITLERPTAKSGKNA